MLVAYTSQIVDFGEFLLTAIILILILLLPFYALVLVLRRRKQRAEQRRLRQIINAKEWPHVTIDRSKPPKAKLKPVEAHTMPLGLNKMVRTGVPDER